MTHLDAARLPKAICTRNFDAPVAHLLSRFLPDLAQPIHPIITRDFRPPKPDPAGILFIARSWGLFSPSKQRKDGQQQQSDGDNETTQGEQEVDASGLIMVGDSIDDMTAGRRAGAATVLLTNPANAHLEKHPHTDLVIRRLDELPAILDNGFVGRSREDGEGGAADSAA